MSDFADPSKATAYQDGDLFRAPAGTLLPIDPLAELGLVTGVSPDEVDWDCYGGVEKGLDMEADQDVKKLYVANKKDAVYAVVRGPKGNTFKFRATDRTKATFKTFLEGGEVVAVPGATGLFEYKIGKGEEFALLWRAVDVTASTVLYTERARISKAVGRSFDLESLDGWEFEVTALSTVREFGTVNPLTP